MAKNNVDLTGGYEHDAFDNPPAGPTGVHRGNRSIAARTLPFVAVIVAAALCGVLAWGWFSGEIANIQWPWQATQAATAQKKTTNADNGKTDKADKTDKPADAETKNDAQSDGQSQQPDESADAQNGAADGTATAPQEQPQQSQQPEAQQQEQTPAPVADRSTAVRVINGTRRNGYAGTKAAQLQRAGYTAVTAGNPTGSLPSSTVVWYQSEAQKATAEDVAATLGIANVQQATGISAPVVVVLMS